ncbi:glycosyltransferase family 4 protein [Nitrospirillum pindoramense]|uniref:Glycosyltransferase involved in cell wall biosynthesis n=1 Tax=Nitrospirillum amazonense TaxID=28077 RepID=A0A560HAY0_9PROT|nr:glycosyltransferase family 4 protein [Nitrospirillum amazonense]TWB43493.1 glycosyltransferase involved in cell wall biosynthesis [Nitrospirillum amazonense]
MRLLFVHQNFPGQYRHLAIRLAAAGHEVVCLGDQANCSDLPLPHGMVMVRYPSPAGATQGIHHYVASFEAAVRRGQTVLRACIQLAQQGFVPDVICAHPGWGEALFLKDVFPKAKLLAYLEFFYNAHGADVGFDPEFPPVLDDVFRIRIKNSVLLHGLQAMDAGITPTRWQAQCLPADFRRRVAIVHDGVDTRLVCPDPAAVLTVTPDGAATPLVLRAGDEVITFVNRNLEPYRGFHTFLRALPELMRQRPNAQVVIVGGDDVSYGTRPQDHPHYRAKYMAEVGDQLDLARVHFLGKVPYDTFLSVLRVSAVHVYLTYPFVLSWSLMEALASGCLVVASDTAPVREVIKHGQNGLLVDFFSPQGLARTVAAALADRERLGRLRHRARETIVQRYDLENVCLPAQMRLIDDLAAGRWPAQRVSQRHATPKDAAPSA